jgi:phosphoadenosine phosphosulfate reductase
MTNLIGELEFVKSNVTQFPDPADWIQWIGNQYGSAACLSTSFSEEDQILTKMIAETKNGIGIFTLDTGRMFAETYSTWSFTLEKYGYPIRAFYPREASLEEFILLHGPNSFYESVENRKSCCHIRKVEPLGRALQGKKIWITGIRAAHSASRHEMPSIEWDATHQLIKIHPLLHWTHEQVKGYIRQHDIPYNSLHDKGFVSIGCAPCTRAIRPGEDFRAGRWWWEDSTKKECGLHETIATKDKI